MHKDKCIITETAIAAAETHPNQMAAGSEGEVGGEERELGNTYNRQFYSAWFLEMAQKLYSVGSQLLEREQKQHPYTGAPPPSIPPSTNSLKNQAIALIMSLSLRLDADTSLRELERIGKGSTDGKGLNIASHDAPDGSLQDSTTSEGGGEHMQSIASNLSHLLLVEEKASLLMNELSQRGEAPLELNHVLLVLQLAMKCRVKSADVDEFVDQHQEDFVSLSAEELLRCAEIAMAEGAMCVSVARKMLQFGIQVRMRISPPDYSLIGTLYRKLIYLSPSRLKVNTSLSPSFIAIHLPIASTSCGVDA